ncbi:hypothetical protein M440DRAFT_1322101 [Trichoderma longibrachiatum ATCC 18648]|uniref:transketolase n=1 Tax=Trichoderma longibrachiatum ATCC 18648 TaxID=983965 RepID=A0A2T4CHG1_TRILO|nr:hypothetical protein M440DRAFT_1322101 [Trichoderma longibrachiatum ATCC 18648]
MGYTEVDQKAINTIRLLAVDATFKSNSGHPGAPMGMAPVAHVLWDRFMRFNPKNPKWLNRDRFVLSNGHGCMLQYALLHLFGYDLTIDDLKAFRTVDSKTPGHPEAHDTPGVEVTTGPLGQGISNAVGLAMAQAHTAATFNKPGFNLCDNYTYCFLGDGCLMEGVSAEASSLAGHLQLGNLICIYDDNHISIDGDTNVAFTEDVAKRYESYGWHVETSAAYYIALTSKHTPSIIALSRQNLPQLEGSVIEKAIKGGYVLQEVEGAQITLVSTGSEVSIAVDAAKYLLEKHNVKARVVSMPCFEVFDAQSKEYRLSVLPDGIPSLSIEVMSTMGWERYTHEQFGLNRFGASGAYKDVYKKFEFTPEGITKRALLTIDFWKDVPNVRSPINRAFQQLI